MYLPIFIKRVSQAGFLPLFVIMNLKPKLWKNFNSQQIDILKEIIFRIAAKDNWIQQKWQTWGFSNSCQKYLKIFLNLIHTSKYSYDPWLSYETCRLLARIGGNHFSIQQSCIKMISNAIKIDVSKSLFYEELGFVLKMQGQYDKALKAYEKAVVMDGIHCFVHPRSKFHCCEY